MYRKSLGAVVVLSSAVFAATPTGQFTTAGPNGTIYDPAGNPFVARGVNIPGHNNWVGRDPTGDVSLVADAWGFNMVRVINMPFLSDPLAGRNINLDAIISAYTAKKIVVAVEVHEASDSYFEGAALTQAANWFGSLAAKYKDNPYVWFNTSNESGNMKKPTDPAQLANWDIWTPDGPKWLTMNRTIIAAIRAAGNTNPVMVDGTNGGQDQAWDDLGNLNPKHSAILTYGPQLTAEFSNVIFDTHIYGEWSSPGAVPTRLRKYLDAAKTADLPIIFGEYGATIWGDWYQTQVEFLKVANEYNVGRLAWSWSDGSGWYLTNSTDPNAVGKSWYNGGAYLINDTKSPTNLSAFGKLVWADTRLPGDANSDGRLDADDYAVLDRSLAAGNAQAHWFTGDFNNDGHVNAADYLILDAASALAAGGLLSPGLLADRQTRFGSEYVAALTTAVPEPTAPLLLLATATALPVLRRRK